MLLATLPAWFPSDMVAIFAVVLIGSMLVMSWGKWWALNVVMRNEAVPVALGVTIAVAHAEVAEMVGSGSPDAWLTVGVFTALLGVIMWRSDGLDLPGL